jgi:hypothetical protein
MRTGAFSMKAFCEKEVVKGRRDDGDDDEAAGLMMMMLWLAASSISLSECHGRMKRVGPKIGERGRLLSLGKVRLDLLSLYGLCADFCVSLKGTSVKLLKCGNCMENILLGL